MDNKIKFKSNYVGIKVVILLEDNIVNPRELVPHNMLVTEAFINMNMLFLSLFNNIYHNLH